MQFAGVRREADVDRQHPKLLQHLENAALRRDRQREDHQVDTGPAREFNEIVHGARTRIVECGSGVSTVVLARLLRERGACRLVALEHDRDWAALVREQLRREALDGTARVLDAPLEGEPPWYGPARLVEVPDEVDLLVVDGPPACDAGHGMRRAPALPRFEECLVVGAAVMLDDIARPGERDVLARWEASTDWRFALDERAGVAIGRRQKDARATNRNRDSP